MTDMTAFLQGHVPPGDEPPFDPPFDHSRKVECRALVPIGRPRIGITEELTDKVCEQIAAGKTTTAIGAMEGMPSARTIERWIAHDAGFQRSYAAAKMVLADNALVETLGIADDGSKDFKLQESAEGVPTVVEDKETLGRSKLRIDTRFRVIAQLAPTKYGDVTITPTAPAVENHNGDGAKVIDGTVIPLEQHPLYDSIMAWRRAAKEAKEAK